MSEAETEKTPPQKTEEKKSSDKATPAVKKTAAAKKTTPPPAKKSEAPGEDKPKDFTRGEVNLADLRILTKDSDSVRRLQTALGTNVTGDFDRGTQRALRAWQNKMGFDGGRGIQVNANQTDLLFGDKYKVIHPKD